MHIPVHLLLQILVVSIGGVVIKLEWLNHLLGSLNQILSDNARLVPLMLHIFQRQSLVAKLVNIYFSVKLVGTEYEVPVVQGPASRSFGLRLHVFYVDFSVEHFYFNINILVDADNSRPIVLQ